MKKDGETFTLSGYDLVPITLKMTSPPRLQSGTTRKTPMLQKSIVKASLSAANCCYIVLKAGKSKDLSKINKSPSKGSSTGSQCRPSKNNGHMTIRSGQRGMNHVFFYIPWMFIFTLLWKLYSLPAPVSLGKTIEAAAKPKRFRERVEKRNSQLQVLTWPPIPTDFNPSRNLWDVLGKSDPRRLQLITS